MEVGGWRSVPPLNPDCRQLHDTAAYMSNFLVKPTRPDPEEDGEDHKEAWAGANQGGGDRAMGGELGRCRPGRGLDPPVEGTGLVPPVGAVRTGG